MSRITPEIEKALHQQLLREECKKDLYTLAKGPLGYQELRLKTHHAILEALEGVSHRKLLVCPRGAFKSSLASISYPIWRLLRDPNLRILLDSELYQNSKNFLREIKGHLEGQALTQLFGPFRSDTHWTEGSITIRQRTRNIKEASITCSGIGAEKTGQHYDVIILDDANSPNNSATEEGRKKIIDHYRYMQSILEPTGTLVVVGTRYHAQDVIGFILEQELDFQNDGSEFS